MNRGRVLYHLVKADFLERVRRYSFLLTLAGALYLAYAVVTEKAQLRRPRQPQMPISAPN